MATGTPLAQEYLTYDNAGPWQTPPQRGDVTKMEDWLDQTNSLLASHGRVRFLRNWTASTDPLGERSETVFDSTYHIFAIKAHDPLYLTDPRHKDDGAVPNARRT